MAIHGLPYDAVAMTETLGPVYYLLVGLELPPCGRVAVHGLDQAFAGSPAEEPLHPAWGSSAGCRFSSKNSDFSWMPSTTRSVKSKVSVSTARRTSILGTTDGVEHFLPRNPLPLPDGAVVVTIDKHAQPFPRHATC